MAVSAAVVASNDSPLGSSPTDVDDVVEVSERDMLALTGPSFASWLSRSTSAVQYISQACRKHHGGSYGYVPAFESIVSSIVPAERQA